MNFTNEFTVTHSTEVTVSNNDYLPASGSFLNVTGCLNFTFIVHLGAVADDLTFQVVQDKGATATADIKNITGATVSALSTDDDKQVVIEVDYQHLDGANGFSHVALQVSGVSGVDTITYSVVKHHKQSGTAWVDVVGGSPVLVAG